MYSGKLVLAQVMDHLPWHKFHHLVDRYSGNHRVKSFTCSDQCRCMAFAKLTWRSSLRDIETCLRAWANKLCHMGIRGGVARNTLSNANNVRDWRLYAAFTQHLGKCAEVPHLDRHIRPCPGGNHSKAPQTGREPPHNSTDSERNPFEKMTLNQLANLDVHRNDSPLPANQLNLVN